jgi:hypothetical protein
LVACSIEDVESGYGGTLDFSKANLEDLIPVQEAIEPIDAFVNTSQRQEAIESPLTKMCFMEPIHRKRFSHLAKFT